MESAAQRLYSVLTRTDVLDKMMKAIVQISEVFSVSQSDATLALILLGWDSFRASDLLGDNKEKFLSKLGLVQVSNHTDADGDTNLVSPPLCSHKFCNDCWKDHLEKKKDEKKMMISCLDRVCLVSVGPDTIEKLPEPVKEMYERYVLGSFMDSNKIKWCPAKGCEYAIERHEDPSEDGDDQESSDFGVVCLCGHTFCWRCKLESHRPVTCNNASLWLNELLGEAKRLTSMTTKPCPHCNSKVQRSRNGYWTIVTCVCCSFEFCWRCLIPEEYHRGAIRCVEVYVPTPHDEAALDLHLALWKELRRAVKVSRRDLEAIEQNSIPILTETCGLGELDMRALREACALIVQCRLVLKWCSVFGYFITDYHSARKQYLDHLVEGATENLLKHKGRVDELVTEAISGGVVAGFRHKIETSTTVTGNYFHVFVKTVEDGLREVKAGVHENVPTEYWFCDRCTFQNDAFVQKCKICVFPFEGPSPPLVGLGNNNTASAYQQGGTNTVAFGGDNNNNTASAHQQGGTNTVAFGDNNNNTASAPHQQGVPNMSSNPFAHHAQFQTNVFETTPPVAFGNSNSAQQQQVPNTYNNPFALPAAFGNNNNSIGASVHQQQVPNMANNPFVSPGVTFYAPVSFPSVAYGAHQQGQVPYMASNPFAHPGGTNPFQSLPFVGFGNNNNNGTASAYQQEAPNMMGNNPFAPPVGLGNSSSTHDQQQAPVKKEPNLKLE